MQVSSIRHRETTSRFPGEGPSEANRIGSVSADDATRPPHVVWLVLTVLVVLLAGGCDGDTDTESIDTGSLTAEDLSGLLPDAEAAGSVFGVTLDQVDERSGISDGFSQGFEHADDEVIEDLRDASGLASTYRASGESEDRGLPSLHIQVALFGTAGAAEGAMEVLTGELEVGDPTEFDVINRADADRGFIFDAEAPPSTWTMVRWDTLLVAIVASHPADGDPIETARGLVEEVRANLATGKPDQ